MKRTIFLILFCVLSFGKAQQFEGIVKYTMIMDFVIPESKIDSIRQEIAASQELKDAITMSLTYYHKDNRMKLFLENINESGFVVYNPDENAIYTWAENSTKATRKIVNNPYPKDFKSAKRKFK